MSSPLNDSYPYNCNQNSCKDWICKKLYMDNSSIALSNDLHTETNCCRSRLMIYIMRHTVVGVIWWFTYWNKLLREWYDDLHTETNCCGSLQTNKKVMCKNSGPKTKLKSGDIKTWVTGNMTATVWEDKRNVNILTNMHCTPAEVKLCD